MFTPVVEFTLAVDNHGGGQFLVGDIDGRVRGCSHGAARWYISRAQVHAISRGAYTVGATVIVAVGVFGEIFTAALQKGAA